MALSFPIFWLVSWGSWNNNVTRLHRVRVDRYNIYVELRFSSYVPLYGTYDGEYRLWFSTNLSGWNRVAYSFLHSTCISIHVDFVARQKNTTQFFIRICMHDIQIWPTFPHNFREIIICIFQNSFLINVQRTRITTQRVVELSWNRMINTISYFDASARPGIPVIIRSCFNI